MANGHKLYELNMEKGENLDSQLRSVPAPVDLVIWEFFGAFSRPGLISRCQPPVAAYCVDAPLNEFWLRHILKNIDYVFVDQPQCVASLAQDGIEAFWLPLPAQKTWFQPQRRKRYDITFVGRTNGLRLKRNNLLNLLQSRFEINIRSGLSLPETQKIFSESKIIINENFFPGLTMRVLQGLSAGALVFTEQSPYNDDFGLRDNTDVVCYNPDNVLERLSDLVAGYDKYAPIGVQGQKKCERLYACGRVAEELVSRVVANGMRKQVLAANAWIWHKTISELLYAQRFGGVFSEPMRSLKTIAASGDVRAAQAHALWGDIQARFQEGRGAWEHYRAALDIAPGSIAALKIALLHIQRQEPDKAREFIEHFLRNLPAPQRDSIHSLWSGVADRMQATLAAIAEIYFFLGSRFDLGFQKAYRDPVPDTAFDAASLAWELQPSPWALDMMSRCLRPFHLQGELLPRMLEGIRAGILSDSQIVETARMAFEYYDRETASTVLAAMKKSG